VNTLLIPILILAPMMCGQLFATGDIPHAVMALVISINAVLLTVFDLSRQRKNR
jgi:hypothetical protein